MRSSAALVYNCNQTRILLAGTSFATTGTLVPQRSAGFGEAHQKRLFWVRGLLALHESLLLFSITLNRLKEAEIKA